MKKLILSLAILAGTLTVSAKTEVKNDTIAVESAKIEKVITNETTNSKGNKVTKYYFVYDGELVPTSQSVAEVYVLAKEYGAKCGLAMVVNRKSHRKRIIRD